MTMWRWHDDGNALLIAVAVTSVCLTLTLVGVQLALSSSRASGLDRQRVLAVNAAEAGVDSAYAAIQNAGLNLPCTMALGDVRSAPDTASYNTVITYYDAVGTPLSCPLAGIPSQALIRSTATTNTLGGGSTKPTRIVEALVSLTPQSANGLNKTIFANGALDASVAISVVGNGLGANADLYSNTSITCGVSMNVAGSMHSQGNISTATSCTVAGDLWAAGNVTTGVSSAVGGFVKASTGKITTGVASVVTGNLYAGTTIAYAGCVLPGKCFTNNSPGAPPVLQFPIIRGDDATIANWTSPSPGYTLYDDNVNCGTIWQRIRDTYSKLGTPTLLRTTCAISFPVATSIALSNDLAIFAPAGISAGVASGFTATVKRNLHWIVPYDAAVAPCTTPSISTSVSFSVSANVSMFAYSPCDMNFNVAGTMNGQIYGGSKVTNSVSFAMKYQSMPTYGIDPSSLAGTSYKTSVVYKRESR